MGFLSGDKPVTAVTTTIERLTSDGYDEDDVSEIVELMEIITIQPTGPTEAARAIRKKLKYGTKAKQLRALTVLEALVQNGGTQLSSLYNDPYLLERLRVTAIESLTDPKVKRRLQALFSVWSTDYRDQRGYEGLAQLYKQLPQKTRNRHRTGYRQDDRDGDGGGSGGGSSRRVREGDVFDDAQDDGESDYDDAVPSSSARVRGRLNRGGPSSVPSSPKPPRRSHAKSSSTSSVTKKVVVKDAPKLNKAIADANTAATNLNNALQLVNREFELATENKAATDWFNKSKSLRRQILRHIHSIESEEYIGSLIHANEELVSALRSYDAMSRPPEEDSDSHEEDGDDEYEDDWKIDSEFNRKMTLSDEEDHDPNNPFDDANVVTEPAVFDTPARA